MAQNPAELTFAKAMELAQHIEIAEKDACRVMTSKDSSHVTAHAETQLPCLWPCSQLVFNYYGHLIAFWFTHSMRKCHTRLLGVWPDCNEARDWPKT